MNVTGELKTNANIVMLKSDAKAGEKIDQNMITTMLWICTYKDIVPTKFPETQDVAGEGCH